MRLRARVRSGFAIALLLLAGGCATGHPAPIDPLGERACWPSFPYQGGWLGGDGAYSVPLQHGRTLWLFGDSFVGAPGAANRVGARFIHNSIGVSTCHPDGRFEIHYAWGTGPDGAARALLERGEPSRWWWLFGGFVRDDRLYIALLEVESAPPQGALAVPFRVTGTSMAEIRDFTRDPRTWQPRVMPLSNAADAFALAAQVVHGDHLYLFGNLDRGAARPRFLARLPLAAFDAASPDLPGAIETLGPDGRWLPGLQPDAAQIVMEDSATEMSVVFHAPNQTWLALYSHPEVDSAFPESRPSDAVSARTASALEGPWSEAQPVFRFPELAPGRGDPHTGCYAAKEQPQFSRPGSATFTYVCNLFTGPGEDPFAILGRLQVQMGLYRPVPVTVTLPAR